MLSGNWTVSFAWSSLAFLAASCTHPKPSGSASSIDGPIPNFDGASESQPLAAEIAEAKEAAKPATKQSPPKAVPSRDDEIWAAVNDRVSTQVDIWFDLGDFPKSIQLLEFEQHVVPASYDVATSLGWMYENVLDYDSAVVAYKRYEVENPSEPDNALPLAEMYFRQKKYAKVIETVAHLLNRKKLHANNYRITANSYERLNELNKAESALVV